MKVKYVSFASDVDGSIAFVSGGEFDVEKFELDELMCEIDWDEEDKDNWDWAGDESGFVVKYKPEGMIHTFIKI